MKAAPEMGGGINQSTFNNTIKSTGDGTYYGEFEKADVSIMEGPARPGTGASNVMEISLYDNSKGEFLPTIRLYDATLAQAKERAFEEFKKLKQTINHSKE